MGFQLILQKKENRMSKRSKKSKSKRPKKTKQPQQIRHPISKLPLFTSMIHDGLAHTEEQYETFLKAKAKPHVLDDAIVNRAERLYKAQREDVKLYERQLTWWQEETLTDSQRKQVEGLLAKLPQIKERSGAILELLAEIQKGTIDRIMEKDDLTLGLEFLMGKLNRKDENT